MKYIDEYRDGEQARHIAANIAAEVRPGHSYRFMEFCGGHTHAIARYGIAGLLPESVRMIHGPGCPVCVLPIGRIDLAIRLALERGVMLCTYGDTMRVPASEGLSLIKAKARGADVRMVYSAADALALADKHPEREVVFLAIGFETTTPPTALVLREARERAVPNFSVLCCHVLTPAAITHILESAEVRQLGTVPIDGFIGPAHVSIVIGSQPYEHFAEEYRKPVVIAGFEPLDRTDERRTHDPELEQMFRRTIDIRLKIEDMDMSTDRRQYAADRRTIDSGEHLEHKTRDRHQRAGIAGRHARIRLAALHEINGDAH